MSEVGPAEVGADRDGESEDGPVEVGLAESATLRLAHMMLADEAERKGGAPSAVALRARGQEAFTLWCHADSDEWRHGNEQASRDQRFLGGRNSQTPIVTDLGTITRINVSVLLPCSRALAAGSVRRRAMPVPAPFPSFTGALILW